MILLDTKVLIYASTERSPFLAWARRTIAAAVSGGLTLLDVPVAAAEPCAKAHLKYRERRRAESGRDAPALPLPDFFIGAHAQITGWPLATAAVES